MGRGSTDKHTIRLQNYLRWLEYNDREKYAALDELLAEHGYNVYRNSSNVLMVRKPKDITGFTPAEVHWIVTGKDA